MFILEILFLKIREKNMQRTMIKIPTFSVLTLILITVDTTLHAPRKKSFDESQA